MKAVFSFWKTTNDTLFTATNWLNPKFQLYSWVISSHKAKEFYENVELVTDSESLPLFNKLELPFDSIKTDLDEINHYPRSLWALGKIKAYQIQDEPFIHLDNDVYIWNDTLSKTDFELLCQNIEINHDEYYQPMIDYLNNNSVIVDKTLWELEKNISPCTAIYGCKNMKFNKIYCDEVFKFVNDNLDILKKGNLNNLQFSVIFEQYIAGQIAKKLNIEWQDFLKIHQNKNDIDKGYIHIWGAKYNNEWFNKIENIVKRDYSKHYKIINELIK